MDRPITKFARYVLLIGLMGLGTGCQTATQPVVPEPAVTAGTPATAPAACPTLEEVCAVVGRAVYNRCGMSMDYDRKVDYYKCRTQTIDEALAVYDGCFSPAEQNQIASCAREWAYNQELAVTIPRHGSKHDFQNEP